MSKAKSSKAKSNTSQNLPSKEEALKLYKEMLLIRRFEEKAGDLVASGAIKTPCHLYIGEEAVATGVCQALNKEDYIFGNHPKQNASGYAYSKCAKFWVL